MPLAKSTSGTTTIVEPMQVMQTLDKGVYLLRYNPQKDYFYLEQKEKEFSLPSKIYNNPQKTVDMWIKSWQNTKGNLGILLTGLKGSGKTVTAKMLCNQLDAPVILITESFTGDTFINFLSSPEFSGSVVFLDEFEKVYAQEVPDPNKGSAEALLSIVEGTFDTHLLFLFTANTTNINSHFLNRPGRIRFLQQFSSLKAEECIEIVDDLLLDESKKEELLSCLDDIDDLSVDIVTKIIHEINIQNMQPVDILGHLNVSLMKGDYDVFVDIVLAVNVDDNEGGRTNIIPPELIIKNMKLTVGIMDYEIPKLRNAHSVITLEFTPGDAKHLMHKVKNRLPELRLEGTEKDFELWSRPALSGTNFCSMSKEEVLIVRNSTKEPFTLEETIGANFSSAGMFKKVDGGTAEILLTVQNIRLRKIKRNRLVNAYSNSRPQLF